MPQNQLWRYTCFWGNSLRQRLPPRTHQQGSHDKRSITVDRMLHSSGRRSREIPEEALPTATDAEGVVHFRRPFPAPKSFSFAAVLITSRLVPR